VEHLFEIIKWSAKDNNEAVTALLNEQLILLNNGLRKYLMLYIANDIQQANEKSKTVERSEVIVAALKELTEFAGAHLKSNKREEKVVTDKKKQSGDVWGKGGLQGIKNILNQYLNATQSTQVMTSSLFSDHPASDRGLAKALKRHLSEIPGHAKSIPLRDQQNWKNEMVLHLLRKYINKIQPDGLLKRELELAEEKMKVELGVTAKQEHKKSRKR
jgi:hypothetical protein